MVGLGMRGFKSDWLFCDPETGRKSSDKSLRLRFRKISDIIGFRVHPHMMRHTTGTMLVKYGDQLKAMQHLGHSTLEMTNVYTHLTGRDLRKNQKEIVEKIMFEKNIHMGDPRPKPRHLVAR